MSLEISEDTSTNTFPNQSNNRDNSFGNMDKEGHLWVKNTADKIIETFPDMEVYTFAAGISPSGTVHFGNFRDVMTSVPLIKEMNERGLKTRFVFSWDDFDRFRKVPANVPPSFEKYIGLPLSVVPDPLGETESYAKHFEMEFEEAMKKLGIDMTYFYQTKEYKSGRYDDSILMALENREKVAKTLLSLMSDKAKGLKGIKEDEYIKDYYPISVYSRFTGKDNTKVLSTDGPIITYLCRDTNKKDTIDLTKERNVKLQWKIDWPMRWREEKVVFEPGGHDHASPGGSFDAASRIAREVFEINPPVFVGYEFIGLRGLSSKMSGSSGLAISPGELLKIYQPQILKELYLRKSPSQKFDLAFDTEIFRQYDEYDREYPNENNIPFRQAVAFGEILQWDMDKIQEILDKAGFQYTKESVSERVERAKYWLEKYNPEKKIKIRDEVNTEYVISMNDESKSFVKELKNYLQDKKDLTIDNLTEILYNIPKVGVEGNKELIQQKQKAFYKDLYNLLISVEKGPRLATFLYALDREKVLKLLAI